MGRTTVDVLDLIIQTPWLCVEHCGPKALSFKPNMLLLSAMPRKPEPHYEGRSLSSWLDASCAPNLVRQYQATQASPASLATRYTYLANSPLLSQTVPSLVS